MRHTRRARCGAELRDQLAEQGIEVIAPTQPEPAKPGRFPKSDFEIDLQGQRCTCPAGEVSSDLRTGKHGDQEFRFAEAVCQACPFKEQCLGKNDRGRRVKLHPYEADLQKARAQQKLPEFRTAYRQRPLVERCNAELKRHGLRKARYRGNEKLDLQALWTASVLNLKRLFKWLQTEPGAPVRLSAAVAG